MELKNIVGFKAVDKDGNEQNVTVDEIVDMVATRMVSALSETSDLSEISTFATAAATGNDVYENELPTVTDASNVRVLQSNGNAAQMTMQSLATKLGELIGMATYKNNGLMHKNEAFRYTGKPNNLHCCLKLNIKEYGENANGFLYVADTNGVTSTIAVSATIWNTNRVYCKLISGGNEYIKSISYKKEEDSMLIFIEIIQYANIVFAPMPKYYDSSLEKVSSIPSDAIKVDFLT